MPLSWAMAKNSFSFPDEETMKNAIPGTNPISDDLVISPVIQAMMSLTPSTSEKRSVRSFPFDSANCCSSNVARHEMTLSVGPIYKKVK